MLTTAALVATLVAMARHAVPACARLPPFLSFRSALHQDAATTSGAVMAVDVCASPRLKAQVLASCQPPCAVTELALPVPTVVPTRFAPSTRAVVVEEASALCNRTSA